MGEVKQTIFDQINIEYEIDCCFYNSLRHYGHLNEDTKIITKFEDIIKYLNLLNRDYIIFEDSISLSKEFFTQATNLKNKYVVRD